MAYFVKFCLTKNACQQNCIIHVTLLAMKAKKFGSHKNIKGFLEVTGAGGEEWRCFLGKEVEITQEIIGN